MKKLVILYSGGLDSLIMKKYAEISKPGWDIRCVYYAHGADSEEQEIKSLPSYVEVRRLDWLDENHRPLPKKSDPYAGAIYIPGRNMVLATLAATQELPDLIWMGTLADENNEQATDKNEKFLRLLNETLSYVLSPFKQPVVEFPFVNLGWTKLEAVKWAKSYLTDDELKSTVSCWHKTTDKPCGNCKQCLKRALIFGLCGIEEEYESDPLTNEYGRELMNKYLDNEPTNADEEKVRWMIKEYYGIK